MQIIGAADLAAAFTFPDLVETLRQAFRRAIVTPVRHHHPIAIAGEPDAMLLLMPAWDDREAPTAASPSGVAPPSFLGVKVVAVHPGNAVRGKATVNGAYLLMDGMTGEPLAALDGQALTLWRTASASALAASYLARPDAARLVMVGAGALAPYLVAAHASQRPLREVLIWNRAPERARALAARLGGGVFTVAATEDLEAAVRAADIVSCATLATEPLVHGVWLRDGAHLDLVGGFTPQMRECDDAAVARARVYVDTRAGALAEAGDIVQPLRSGALAEAAICGDLFDLCRDRVAGRRTAGEVTLFKSVGAALEDLAAAAMAYGARSHKL